MNPETIAALVTGLATFTGLPLLLKRIRNLESKLSAATVKINLLWEIYAVDAMKAARSLELSETNSPVKMTNKWGRAIPLSLRASLESDFLHVFSEADNPNAGMAALFMSINNLDALKEAAENSGIPLKAVIGGVIDFANVLTRHVGVIGEQTSPETGLASTA